MSEQAAAKTATIGLPQGEMYRGDKIGNYEVLTQLSVGGMAELFLCFTQGAGAFRKFVVVKRILPDVKSNESYIKMFYDEARITSVLHHPNIAQVLDLGGEGDQAYIAMEFIAGQNLNQVSAACLKRRRLIPVGLSVSVCRDICHALHYAHTIKDSHGRESPIIHRDVAQKNVMVTYEGAVKLLDFGIAKARGSLGRTTAGMVKGTTGYMSPEQVRGEVLDGRSDVFCLGVVLFELLTGKRLFAAETETEEMERILAAPIPRPDSVQRKIPSGLVDLVLKALARDRSQRFPTARAMAKALDEVGGKWMYDADKRAAFMRNLFADRIEATRKLLDSAGRNESSDETRKAAHTLTEDAGAVFPELNADTDPEYLPEENLSTQVEPVPTPGPDQNNPVPLEPLVQGVPVPSGSHDAAAHPPPDFDDDEASLPPRSRAKWPLRAAAVVVLAAGAGIAAWLSGHGDPPPSPSPPAPISTPVAAPAPAPEPAPSATIAPSPQPAQPPEPAKEPEGTLTLSTSPRAKVYLGQVLLGQTPFNAVSVEAGRHQLTLVPSEGPARRLEVKIEAGQPTRIAGLKLSSLAKARR
ncbi:MAG TPA: serine/threonine-protein kinase [Myxococcales bacterium]|nr:serine/threonine-protein kinase [Myxococcales bacterium]